MNPELKIVALFSVLALLLVVIGTIIGYLFNDILLFASLFLVLALGMNIFSYFESDKIALKATGSRIVSEKEEPRLYRIVKSVAEKAGIPTPKIGVMETDVPNAFATGRNAKNAVVVATRGIMRMLDDDELEAVIGHEISHITHKDILVSTIAATIATMISYIGNMILFSEMFGGTNENRNGNGILLFVAALLIPLGAMFVQLGISRSREAYADVGSVKLVKKPDELISALRKISSVHSAPSRKTKNAGAYSSLFIVNNLSKGSLFELFSTHPSLEKRIENINNTRKELGL
ncbi:MAG: M48 family metalloprotease [Nanoarchaeota archaeon]|nr:M48 family metalloprotease [Nanoarchaeota archaeon]